MKPFANVAVVKSGLVTVTFTVPVAWAGVSAVIVEEFTTVTLVAAAPEKFTVAPLTKFDPFIVTRVPPDAGPVLGVMPLIPTTVVYVNPPTSVADVESGFVTTTSTAPAACRGVVAVIWNWLTTTMLVAGEPPNVTVAPLWKRTPEMVTGVPPLVDPEFGVTLLIVTVPVNVKAFGRTTSEEQLGSGPQPDGGVTVTS